MLGIHTAVFLFGLAGLFGKLLPLPPLAIVFGRVFLASLALFLALKILKIPLLPEKIPVLFLSFLGFVLAIHWVTFFHSIQISTVAIGLLSYSSFPIFTVFLEPLFFKEKLIKTNLFLSIVAFFGIAILIPEMEIKNKVTQGILVGLVSGFTFSVLSIFNRKFSQKYSSLLITFYECLSATLFLSPFIFLTKSEFFSFRDIILLVFLGIICTALAHALFIKGMRHVKAQTASIVATLEPVYGILLAFLLLKEIPSIRTIFGGILIIGATIAVTVRKEV